MPQSSRLKIILITGCSSGFGLVFSARLASRGHAVISTMRNLLKQQELLDEVKRRGGKVDILQLDVTNKASIKKAEEQIAAKYGHIDVLINNAGFGMGGFFEDLTDEEIREQMETNFFGVQNVTRVFIPLMRKTEGAKIINISSVSGFSTSPAFGAYNASKWALEAFSESLRYELSFWGIDVLLIEPGIYRTKIFHENARHSKNFDNPYSLYYPMSQHLKSRIMDNINNCHKNPEEVAALAEKLINAKNPKFRNIPDFSSKILFVFRKFLPFRIYSWLIRTAIFKDFRQ